jgi:predicted SprT family Zn-dependent metalloprotease
MNLDDAENLGKVLMDEHGLLAQGWRFAFDRAARRFGRCNYKRKTISLSRPLTLLNDQAQVRNTILHEIAHALLPKGAGHNQAWRSLAVSIGCDGQRLHSAITAPKWLATCSACGHQVKYQRRRKGLACRRCCNGVYDPQFNFTWHPIETDPQSL